jgi:hypothetical protein
MGVVDLEPLLWQAPPLGNGAVVVARDMGPEVNARVRSAMGGRDAYVYVPRAGQGPVPALMDYEEGMQLLWGG